MADFTGILFAGKRRRGFKGAPFLAMKSHALFGILLVIVGLGSAWTDEPAISPEMKLRKERYQRDVEAAVKPVRERYVEDLQGMMKSETIKGHLAAAQACQAELAEVSKKSGMPGKWHLDWGLGTQDVTFLEGGAFTTSLNTRGKWSIEKDKVVMTYTDGHSDSLLLPIDPKGMSGKTAGGPNLRATKIGP